LIWEGKRNSSTFSSTTGNTSRGVGCGSKAQIAFVAGPRVSLSCSCGAETILKPSSWSKYLRAINAPEVSHVEKPLGDGTAVKTLSRDPPNIDETSEFVTVGGMAVPRSGYGGHGSFSPSNAYAKEDDNEVSPSGGAVTDPIVRKWSKKYRYSDSAGV